MNTTASNSQRALLLQLGLEGDDKSALLAYVNLMGIVGLGWRVSIDPGPSGQHVIGILISPSGTRSVRAEAATVALLCRELVHRWMGGTKPLLDLQLTRVAPLAARIASRDSSPALTELGYCDCGRALGRISGQEGMVCIECDAERIEEARKL